MQDLGSRGLLLQTFAELAQQPRVLDGNDGLRGEVLDQLDLLVAEWAYLLTINGDPARS